MNDKAKLIADKMAEPAVAKLKDAWTDPAAPRWLQVTKVKPTGVDHWVVRLRSGKEILLTDEEWNGAIYNADHAQSSASNADLAKKLREIAWDAYRARKFGHGPYPIDAYVDFCAGFESARPVPATPRCGFCDGPLPCLTHNQGIAS